MKFQNTGEIMVAVILTALLVAGFYFLITRVSVEILPLYVRAIGSLGVRSVIDRFPVSLCTFLRQIMLLVGGGSHAHGRH